MSSSRILSSRPSASCITAKPMARTIKGRGRNASPFFAAQKQGKPSGLFRQSPLEALALWLSVPETAQPIAGAQWGRWAFPYRLTGSGEAEVDFLSAHAGSSDLWLSVPKTVQPIAGAQWGHWRFRTTQPEAGKLRGFFRQSPPGTLLYSSLSRKPHGSLPGCCGAMDASASCRRE